MKTISTLWTKLRQLSGSPAEAKPLANASAEFKLLFKGMQVGTLRAHDGTWQFRYDSAFRQKQLRPLVEFPDTEKTYEAPDLWAFFLTRIPSSKQSCVRSIMDKEHIADSDEIRLLERFGRKSVTSPFELVATHAT